MRQDTAATPGRPQKASQPETKKKETRLHSSHYSDDYRVLLELLREAVADAGVTQVEMAARLNSNQPYVSKILTGRQSINVVELRNVCRAAGVSFPNLMAKFDATLERQNG